MTVYEKARNNPRQFKSLTSLSIEKFDVLLPTFDSKWESYIEKYNLDGTPRLRKYVPKNEKQLPTVGDKLFFLLFYKKTHSLQEVMAFQFDLDVKFTTPITMLADLGFKGWNPQNVTLILPYKKPRNTKTEKRQLTQTQKDFNKELSQKRVKVENVLAHIKILRIVKDKNRNYRLGFRENLMKTACGLYNFRLSA